MQTMRLSTLELAKIAVWHVESWPECDKDDLADNSGMLESDLILLEFLRISSDSSLISEEDVNMVKES